jgi:hypothetical protein
VSDMEHLFIGDLRKNPDAEVRLLVNGKLVCGTWPRQVTQSIDAMIREAQAVALEEAATNILTNDPLDYWAGHLPEGLGFQEAMSLWLKAHAAAARGEG